MVRVVRSIVFFAVIAATAALATATSKVWWPWLLTLRSRLVAPDGGVATGNPVTVDVDRTAVPDVVMLSPQARRNLRVSSKSLQLTSGWRTITIPGTLADRPGISDRGVTSPVVGVVARIHAYPGDTVRPGDPLFTLRLLSEYVQQSQSELFKATRETELELEKKQRLEQIGAAIPGARLIEIDQQLRRLQASITGYRQDLLSRGLSPDQIDQAAAGSFVSTVEIVAPPLLGSVGPADESGSPAAVVADAVHADAVYEVQRLDVELGNQVQAGQLLTTLSNHRLLYAVGHAFKREAAALEQAARLSWPVEIEFAEDAPDGWEPLPSSFQIRHIANTIDPASRTFDFFIPLLNQSKSYERDGERFVAWRFRPGQRVRLHVPVEQFSDVFVLPADAVARVRAEAYVFRQNGVLFNRLSVQVLHADRLRAIIANDGSLAPGWFIAQSAAASLNRVLESQAESDMPAGVHVHADGTVHGAH
jgi:cobalt-zinc-cadmium efflux system membrane fusion protein